MASCLQIVLGVADNYMRGCVGHNTRLSSETNTYSRVDTEIMIFSRRMAMVFLFGGDEDAM